MVGMLRNFTGTFGTQRKSTIRNAAERSECCGTPPEFLVQDQQLLMANEWLKNIIAVYLYRYKLIGRRMSYGDSDRWL